MRTQPSFLVVAALSAAVAVACKEAPKPVEAAPTKAPAWGANQAKDPAAVPSAQAPQGERPAPQGLEGKVVETMDAATYTYLNIETATGKVWAAVPQTPVAVGTLVAVDNAMLMSNFKSQTLNRTFPEIYFGVLRGAAGKAPAGAAAAAAPTAPTPPAAMVPVNVKVPKATGPNSFTVAEAIGGAEKLKEKPVTIQATVVKVNNGIMDRNWLHVRDGSGTDADKTNDILVTTSEVANVGDVVTIKGKLVTDKDFGAGYAYKVMVEGATLTKK